MHHRVGRARARVELAEVGVARVVEVDRREEERACEQRAVSSEQRAVGSEQRAVSSEQWAVSSGQWAVSSEQ